MTHENDGHDSSAPASGDDLALLTARRCSRAALCAVEALEHAERSTKPKNAERWRIAALGLLQDARVLAQRSMHQVVDASPTTNVASSHRVELALVLQELEAFAASEEVQVHPSARNVDFANVVRRASATLIAKLGGGR